jgi:hypothetical protein
MEVSKAEPVAKALRQAGFTCWPRQGGAAFLQSKGLMVQVVPKKHEQKPLLESAPLPYVSKRYRAVSGYHL